jgi:hypothetical protein
MKPYQPSLHAPAGGLVVLLFAVVLGGAAIGILVSLLSNLVYLILVFPLLMGLMGGAIAARVVHIGKIRNPPVAILAAAAMGVIIYGSMWAADYVQARNMIKEDVLAQSPGTSQASLEAAIDTFLQKNTGQTGFIGYILVRDQEGESIGRIGSSDQEPLNLGPVFSWVYWGLELVIILWGAIRSARRAAYEPFCEACGRWYEKPQQLGSLGASRSKEVMGLVDNGQFVKLGEELQANPALPNVAVFMAASGNDCTDGDVLLVVRSQVRDSRGNPTGKDLARGMISAGQAQELQRGIQNRRALYGN